MTTTNRIRPEDMVRVVIYYEGREADAHEGSGYHTVEEAVNDAYDASSRTPLDKEDYVYRVTDTAHDTSARYRFNAGGNLRILPEE